MVAGVSVVNLMSTEGDDGPSGSVEPAGGESGGLGGRGSSRKATTKYSEGRSTNSRSLEDTDSVVDEEQPALGAYCTCNFVLVFVGLH